jgi:hypothetical protein
VVSFLLAFPPISYTHSSLRISSSWLDRSISARRTVQIMKLLNMRFSPTSCQSLFGPNILLSILFSNTLSIGSSLNVRDKVSHPYRTSGKIIILYIVIFTSFDSRREDKRLWTEWQKALPEFNLLLISSWIKFWFVTVVHTCITYFVNPGRIDQVCCKTDYCMRDFVSVIQYATAANEYGPTATTHYPVDVIESSFIQYN